MEFSNLDLKQAGEIVQSFISVNKAIIKFTQDNASSLGLTVQQMGVLNWISSNPGSTLKAVTEQLDIPKSTVSVSIDGLVNLGLVEREQSKENRREVNLKVTIKGRDISQKSIKNASSYKAVASALEKFSKEDIDSLLHMHKSLLSSLKEINS
ncbi:MarR family transcriptional regulator [Priestia megaterium]|jgi:DNA-binding MarR family transcriptional regulator|uniref:MarR family winged helix-turn-helix transcriptional regulator n=1 Tax=Priestia TaxID=2800373 RepID=UPI000BEE5DE7|nr:MarR family winged helix-turn-helix transcriptional regulator [Priestia megaterium]PEB61252.1 MarR family transcriptional regulator [Priestia megaterium]PEE73472.1 MarR family transcriptional regulator [Priestia megaterium]PFI89987.1 MarR family transcriptional regulator [Priestia megaterium]PGR05450.1 MarR family transcriptional regulator [Priestia megaterium]